MKAFPQSFSEWFLDWEDLKHPVTFLKRGWVLSNLYADDKAKYNLENDRHEQLLFFSNGEQFRNWKNPQVSAQGGEKTEQGEIKGTETPSDEFLTAALSLPKRRINKPPAQNEYIARRMRELSPKSPVDGMKVVAKTDRPDKPVLFRRTIIIKKKKTNA